MYLQHLELNALWIAICTEIKKKSQFYFNKKKLMLLTLYANYGNHCLKSLCVSLIKLLIIITIIYDRKNGKTLICAI